MTFDIYQTILDPAYGEYDEKAAARYQEAIEELFAESPEGMALAEQGIAQGWVTPFLNYSMSYLGVTPAEMTPRQFDEVLFELFPRKVSVEPEAAPEIVVELRAFWSFLGRAYTLPNAPAILNRLDQGAIARLERELANPANFGMAKSMIMQARARGFDTSTQEGLDAWIQTYNAEQVSTGPGLFEPGPPPLFAPGPARPLQPAPKARNKAKEKARNKMAKASRKQNRRR